MSRRRSPAAAVLVIALALAAGPPAAAQTADEPECPIWLACRFTPAAYAQTDPANPTKYGNYHKADRPRDGDDIRYIVIHDTEETYDRAIARFQDPHTGVSTHYLIRSSDGEITQLVHTRDIAHQAGNYWFNMHSIGIEHEGVLVDGAHWYTEAMYQSSARLVRYLAALPHPTGPGAHPGPRGDTRHHAGWSGRDAL